MASSAVAEGESQRQVAAEVGVGEATVRRVRQAEIAEIVGVSKNTVRNVLQERGIRGRIVQVPETATAAEVGTSEEPAPPVEPTPEPPRVEVGTCVIGGMPLYENEEWG